jgi:catechol 2,3-dioxygenase-like lactoylglutathione lyase family enzyme
MNKRVTGLGGVFFKTDDPKKMREWYGKHLGVDGIFKWLEVTNPNASIPAQTVWSPFKQDTTYFAPSEKPFMFNYRVENLVELLAILKEEGIEQVGKMEEHPYGKFAWIVDPENNKIELWEPIDDGFGQKK